MGVVEMDISYYENEVKKYTDEIAKLEQELSNVRNRSILTEQSLNDEARINSQINEAKVKMEQSKKELEFMRSMMSHSIGSNTITSSNTDLNYSIDGNIDDVAKHYENTLEKDSNELKNLEERLALLNTEKEKMPSNEFEREEENVKNMINDVNLKIETNNSVLAFLKSINSVSDVNTNFNIDYYKEERQKNENEIKNLNNALAEINASNDQRTSVYYLDGIPKSVLLEREEKEKINKLIEKHKKQLEDNNRIISTYDRVLNNSNNLIKFLDGKLELNNPDFKEELEARSKEIARDKKLLPKELVDNLNRNFAMLNKDIISGKAESIKNNDKKDAPDVEAQKAKEEKPIKVAGRKAWNWVKKNKKKIIIALGITAITVAVVMLFAQLMPAITALSQAQQLSAITGTMVNNAASWHGASAAGKAALHLANEGLAKSVMSLTGKTALFNSSTGIWTFAGTELANLAATATTAVTAQVAKVAAISKTAAILGVGGLGVSGLGMLASRKKGNKKSEPVSRVDNTIEQTNTESNEKASTVEQTNVNTENREEVKASEQVNTNTENKRFGDIADSLVEQEENKSVYNKCDDAVNELISLYPKSNEDGKAFLLDRLNILYNDIDTSLKLGMEERELLKEKINSFTDSLEENKGRGK